MSHTILNLLKSIDHRLLPKQCSMRYGPYIWLIYLAIFFVSLVRYHPIENSYYYSAIGTLLFLVAYFNGYWVSKKRIQINILAILILGSMLALLTPGASVFFVYAGAFCCRLGNPKKAFLGLLLITCWIGLLSLFYTYSAFFYIPAVAFTLMVGGINIYQHNIDLQRQQLNLSQQEVRRLARTSERERIARDLHDLIGHTFSVITLKAELAGKLIDKEPVKAKQEIQQLETISRDALTQIREVVSGYRTSDLGTELAHAKYVLQSNEIEFNYEFSNFEMPDKINKELAIILKELVTNVLKHAHANTVRVNIEQQNHQVLFTLQDDGHGFSKQQTEGFGIKGIHERVDKLFGSIEIEALVNPLSGLSTRILIPLGSEQ